MRISDWSSDVCSSDLLAAIDALGIETIIDLRGDDEREAHPCRRSGNFAGRVLFADGITAGLAPHLQAAGGAIDVGTARARMIDTYAGMRSEEHTSELQSLMRISYAVFCLKKKKKPITIK